MKLAELPEDFTPEQFMQLDSESLEQVPFEVVRWQCKIKFCKCYTRLRDYGLGFVLYSKRGVRDTKTGDINHWVNVKERFLICQKHKKYWKASSVEDIPLKKTKYGILWGYDDTKKETIYY